MRTLNRSLIALVMSAVAGVTATARATETAPVDPSFLLTAGPQDAEHYFPAYLANGYIGTTSTLRGTLGTPTYLVGFMDYTAGDMSRPAAVPGWTEIDYSTGPGPTGQQWLNRVPFRPKRFRDYSQVLNLHEATLKTSYVYRDESRDTAVEVATFVDEAEPHLALTQLSITPDFDGLVQLSFGMDLWAPHQPRLALARITGEQMDEQIMAQGQSVDATPPATPDRAATWYQGDTQVLADEADANRLTLWLDARAQNGAVMGEAAAISLPAGLVPESVTVHKTEYRLALDLSLRVRRGQTYTFGKFVAVSRAGWGGDARADLALALAAREAGFDALLARHRAAWSALWQADIRIDGDPRAQLAAHSELYHLYASSTPDTAWPLGACGLTTGYVGHAFWDNDAWIFPALLLMHPERAKSLVMFRSRTLGAAEERAHERHFAGAMYPWEADPENGTEQTPHPAYVLGEREIHVTADVALAQWQYYLATGDLQWLKAHGWPVIREVAKFWASRVSYDAGHRRYGILHVTSVFEPFNDIPNDTYTNAAAARALDIAVRAAALVHERPDPRWADIARRMYLPTGGSDPHHLSFDPSIQTDLGPGFGGTTLLSFPFLDTPMTEQLRRSDYRAAVPPGAAAGDAGNSMGYAPNSIAAATIGNAEDASAWFAGNFTGGTLKPPFNVRTETATNNTGYFLTGSGAYIQNLVFGFTGLRIGEKGLEERYAPLMPAGWHGLTLQNITFRGRRYDVVVTRDASGQVRLTRQPRP
jgi:trehalose/maltose hydrolase-like predicted phosphorylase